MRAADEHCCVLTTAAVAAPRTRPTGVSRPKQPNRIDSSSSASEGASDNEPEGSSDSNGSDSDGDGFESAAAPSLGCFNAGDTVRVWWATEEPAAWCMGVVERVMPASVEVYYEDSDTYSTHRLRTSIIEHFDEN